MGGEDTAMCGSATTNRAALSDKCRSRCGGGYGSELTRRGGGDHGQRQKRVWGAKALTKHQSPPSCTSGLTAAAYIKGKERRCLVLIGVSTLQATAEEVVARELCVTCIVVLTELCTP